MKEKLSIMAISLSCQELYTLVDGKDYEWLNQSQNQFNSRARRGTSRYKGVSWNKTYQKWQAYIFYKGKNRNLGSFNSEEEAAKVYDKVAKQYFGEFVFTNF